MLTYAAILAYPHAAILAYPHAAAAGITDRGKYQHAAAAT
jgi:hypothetical protein